MDDTVPPVAGFFVRKTMIGQILATKRHMLQAWDTTGLRMPVSVLRANDCMVVHAGNTKESLCIGAGTKKIKNTNKPQRSQLEKAGLSRGFTKVVEVPATSEDITALPLGTKVDPSQVLAIGDIVKVTGTSKGMGFAGVVKLHGFKGGPRTHGQADRERAPGSIGSGTTPGRVYKNKKMAGRGGNRRVTVEGLQVVALHGDDVWVKGLVPGSMNSVVLISKVSSGKFVGLLQKEEQKTE